MMRIFWSTYRIVNPNDDDVQAASVARSLAMEEVELELTENGEKAVKKQVVVGGGGFVWVVVSGGGGGFVWFIVVIGGGVVWVVGVGWSVVVVVAYIVTVVAVNVNWKQWKVGEEGGCFDLCRCCYCCCFFSLNPEYSFKKIIHFFKSRIFIQKIF